MAKRIELYKDLDLSLTPHPLTGDVKPLVNTDAVKQSIRNILSFQKWDIPFQSGHGGQITPLLFDQPDPFHISELRSTLEWTIKSLEPRVKVNEIRINHMADDSAYNVTVFYTIKSLNYDDLIDYFFQRIR